MWRHKSDGCGFDSTRGNGYFYFLALVTRQSVALSSATEYSMPQKFDVAFALGSQAPSAYPAMCNGIQREA